MEQVVPQRMVAVAVAVTAYLQASCHQLQDHRQSWELLVLEERTRQTSFLDLVVETQH